MSPEDIKNIEYYLKTNKLPNSIKDLHRSNQYRFIKKAKQYKLEDNKIINVETGYELVKPEEQKDKIINEFKQFPESVDKIYERMRGSGITRQQIKETINSLLPQQLHKQPKPKRYIKHVIANEYGEHFEADIIDMSKYAWHNNGYKFILTIIDVYSRRAWAIKLKSKESKEVISAIKPILINEKVKLLHTDNGSEFTSNEFKDMCESLNVKQIFGTPYTPHSQGHIERFNRTLKSMIYKYFTWNDTKIWINIIDKFVDSYNNTKHSVTLEKPITKTAQQQFRPTSVDSIPKKRRFNIGDKVRIALRNNAEYKKKIFEKKYTIQWSKDIYVIISANKSGDIYKVKNINDDKQIKNAKWEDLQLINEVIEIPQDKRIGREKQLQDLHVTKDKMKERKFKIPEETLIQSRAKNPRARKPNVRLRDI